MTTDVTIMAGVITAISAVLIYLIFHTLKKK
jgi:hypothetical protein